MFKKVTIFTLLISTALVGKINAQNLQPCLTDEVNQAFFEMHPEFQSQILQLQQVFEDECLQQNGSSVERAVKIVPVVFHVIHNYGSENISNAQIANALHLMNLDFNKMQPDTTAIIPLFKPIIGNTQFEFRLARKDPQGNCTNGITRTVSTHTYWADDEAKAIAPIWQRDKYLNVWIVQKLSNGAGGYTIYPDFAAFSPNTDGVILVNQQFGAIGTSSGVDLAKRTLTHEVGHFFRLNHTWGNSNTPGVSCGNDNVDDTPQTKGTNGQGCNTAQSTCGAVDNVQNIMDYASCPKMFTVGQAARMNSCITSNQFTFRKNLWQDANLNATGTNDGFVDTICTPRADFNALIKTVCAGGSLTFKDASWRGTPSSWSWTFTSGSTILTANTANPTVQFNEPGIYDVKLEVSNSIGTNSVTKTAYIQVMPTSAMLPEGFISQDFENFTPNSDGWFIINDDNNGWQLTSAAAFSGTKSLYAKNQNAYQGSYYRLLTPSVNLSQVTTPKLKFKYAYAKQADANGDNIKVSISTDCGASWSLMPPPLSTTNMVTVSGNITSNFIPTAAQWKEFSVNVPATYHNATNARFRIELYSAGGNNVYVDDINVEGPASVKEEIQAQYNYSIFPNPANEILNFSFSLEKSEYINMRILDLTGKLISQNQVSRAAGNYNIEIPVQNLSSGVYIFQISFGDKTVSEKIVIN